MGRVRLVVLVSFVLTIPFVTLWAGVWSASPATGTFASAAAVIGATALTALAIRSMEGLPRGIALTAIAIAVLVPDFSIETGHAWLAVGDGESQGASMMLAAFTGSSRFMLGLVWPAVVLLVWFKGKGASFQLGTDQIAGLVVLLMMAMYVFLIFMRGYMWTLDTPIMILMLMAYFWRLSHSQDRTERLEIDTRAYAHPSTWASAAIILLLVYAATTAFASSRMFADSLIALNTGLDTFSRIQWAMPLVSKLPLVAAVIALVWNRKVFAAISALLTSQVALWSILLGILPVVMLIGGALSQNWDVVWLDERQRIEILLTASQVVFTAAIMSGKTLSWRTSLAMFGMFGAEAVLSALQPQSDTNLIQGLFSILYLGGAAAIILTDRTRLAMWGRTIAPVRRASNSPQPAPAKAAYTFTTRINPRNGSVVSK